MKNEKNTIYENSFEKFKDNTLNLSVTDEDEEENSKLIMADEDFKIICITENDDYTLGQSNHMLNDNQINFLISTNENTKNSNENMPKKFLYENIKEKINENYNKNNHFIYNDKFFNGSHKNKITEQEKNNKLKNTSVKNNDITKQEKEIIELERQQKILLNDIISGNIKKKSEEIYQKNLTYKKNFNNVNKVEKNKTFINEILKHETENSNKFKTVFSIMSENILENVIKNKDFKMNSYENLINENKLQQISEKLSRNIKIKTKEFLERNKNDEQKRRFKKIINSNLRSRSKGTKDNENNHNFNLRSPSALSSTDHNNCITNYSNNGVKIINIRSPEKFYLDQIEFEENKNLRIEEERKKFSEKTDKTLKNKPSINSHSRYLGSQKNSPFKTFKDTHTKLNKSNIKNFKKNNNYSLDNIKDNKKILSEKSINDVVNTLHYNIKRKNNKKSSEKLNKSSFIDELSDFKIGVSSNILVLKNFLEILKNALKKINLYNQIKESNIKIFLNFEEFTDTLYFSGFVKFEHRNNNDNDNYNSENISKNILDSKDYINHNSTNNYKSLHLSMDRKKFDLEKLKEKEIQLIKDSWKILISHQNLENSNENLLNINILIIFLITVIGVYKGDPLKEENNKSKCESNNNEFIKSDNKPQFNLENDFEISGSDDNKNTKKDVNFKVTFAKSCGNNFYHLKNKNLHKKISSCVNKQNCNDKKYLNMILGEIIKIFPGFDYKYFVYSTAITNQIKFIFRELYENWSNQIFSNKKDLRLKSKDIKIKSLEFTFKPKLYKTNVFNEKTYRNNFLLSSSNLFSLSTMDNENISKNKQTSLHDIYKNFKLRKER